MKDSEKRENLTIGVVGLGLIGGSMAKAYKQAGHAVYGYDASETVTKFAILSGTLDGALAREEYARCNLLFVATYPEAAARFLQENAPYFSKHGIVMDLCGTKDDFLIASSCLNSTVSGLLSRTVYRTDLIGPGEFHGAVFYEALRPKDLTYQFIDAIAAHFSMEQQPEPDPAPKSISALEEVERIRQEFSISDRNLIKPSIGETTRVLLRRVPWKILVHSLHDEAYLGHIYALAKEKGVELCEYPLVNYRACGLIRTMADQ